MIAWINNWQGESYWIAEFICSWGRLKQGFDMRNIGTKAYLRNKQSTIDWNRRRTETKWAWKWEFEGKVKVYWIRQSITDSLHSRTLKRTRSKRIRQTILERKTWTKRTRNVKSSLRMVRTIEWDQKINVKRALQKRSRQTYWENSLGLIEHTFKEDFQ